MTPDFAVFLLVILFIVAIAAHAMGSAGREQILLIFLAVFPFPKHGSAEVYVSRHEQHQPDETEKERKFLEDRAANFERLRRSIMAAQSDEILKELRDVALARTKAEDDRQSSIMARAQALLTGLAIFGVVLAFAGTLSASAAKAAGQPIVVYLSAVLVGYVVVMVALMTFNVLRAVGPLSYTLAGNSDLARWVSYRKISALYRDSTLMALDHLRRSKLNNDWRAIHLDRAQEGMRNIAYALSLLALVTIASAICGNALLELSL